MLRCRWVQFEGNERPEQNAQHSTAQHGIIVVVSGMDEAGRIVGKGTGAMGGRRLRHGQKHRHGHRPKRTIKWE